MPNCRKQNRVEGESMAMECVRVYAAGQLPSCFSIKFSRFSFFFFFLPFYYDYHHRSRDRVLYS